MSLRSLSLLCVAASAAAQGSSSRLRVEYLDAPLTIDVATPRFSFAPLHPTRGAALASYRIVVAQVFPSAAPIWDSGVVAATSSLNIGESAAQPARVRTRVYARAALCMRRTAVRRLFSLFRACARAYAAAAPLSLSLPLLSPSLFFPLRAIL